ncbi:MAG: TolB family protein [Candidatus Methylomirabilales bacterium]
MDRKGRLLARRTVLKMGLGAAALAAGCAGPPRPARQVEPRPDLREHERHLANLRQLTFGGQNAEAYFSPDGSQLIFQATRDGFACDQILVMNLDGSGLRLLSTGKGRTTCSFFVPGQPQFIYASTHLGSAACPPRPDRSQGYVWPIYPDYEIFSAALDGSDLRRLTHNWGYDAEGAVSPDGKTIVFTSLREGDLDLYLMDIEGSNVRRLTERVGYDGGPFFSWDGRAVVYRAWHPRRPSEVREYRDLLARHLVRPSKMEIFLMDADGGNNRQVTDLGAASFAPFMHPDGQRIIFASNLHDRTGRTFALYLIRADGTHLERLTYGDPFAAFPMFSRDGRLLVFASQRNQQEAGEMNIFLADWVD